MSRAAGVVAAAAGVAGGVAGGMADPVTGVLVGAAIGGLGGGWVAWRQTRDTATLAAQVSRWLDEPPPRASVHVSGSSWGELVSVLGRLGDVYDEQRRELDRDRPWRHDLVDSLVSAALLFDHGGYLVAANRAARELLGIGASDAPVTVIQALGSAVLADAVARARDAQGGHVEVNADVGARQVRASVAVVGDETLVIVNDRTRERRVEELRRNFVVNASHELKTPATSIHTLSEALAIVSERDPDRVPELVARLHEEAERLVRLVHDLLNLRRLEERPDLDGSTVDLVPLARDVLAELGDRAAARNIVLSLDAPDEATLVGDPEDVRLVVRNLVANAIQYNRDGGRVQVGVTRAADGWRVDVADTGIGIPQQDIQRIFERFYRVDVARSRMTGGTGLGLSIVRHAVERHGGTIRVDSLLGEGSTFTVTLPRGPNGDAA